MFQNYSPRQEVCSSAFELARTGTGKDEAVWIGGIIDQRLEGIQHGREPLHLVNDDKAHAFSRRELPPQQACIFCVRKKHLLVRQIDNAERGHGPA